MFSLSCGSFFDGFIIAFLMPNKTDTNGIRTRYSSESLKTSQLHLDLALRLSEAKGELRFYKNEVLKDVLS